MSGNAASRLTLTITLREQKAFGCDEYFIPGPPSDGGEGLFSPSFISMLLPECRCLVLRLKNGVWGPGYWCNSHYWVWGVLILLYCIAGGACFGLASWPEADLHHSRDMGLKPAEKSAPSSLERTRKVKSCFLDRILWLRHLGFESSRS